MSQMINYYDELIRISPKDSKKAGVFKEQRFYMGRPQTQLI